MDARALRLVIIDVGNKGRRSIRSKRARETDIWVSYMWGVFSVTKSSMRRLFEPESRIGSTPEGTKENVDSKELGLELRGATRAASQILD